MKEQGQPDRCVLREQNLGRSVGNVVLLRDVSFEMRRAEILAVVGPSGSGKSSLLRLIPAIDSLRSLGIVWIPGLMAGMLLSGASPLYSAIYQFVVLSMIFAASGLTALVSTLLMRAEVFSPHEQLVLRPVMDRR